MKISRLKLKDPRLIHQSIPPARRSQKPTMKIALPIRIDLKAYCKKRKLKSLGLGVKSLLVFYEDNRKKEVK